MRESGKDAKVYLDDIRRAIAKIKSFTGKMDEAAFSRNEMAFDATVRNLEIIGEAVAKLPSPFREKHRKIEWRKIVGMRNRLIHGYDEVDRRIVWNVVKNDIPKLEAELKKIKEKK